MSVPKPEMGILIMTKCRCYTAGRKITPRGIVVHSTGANNPNLRRYVGPDDGVLGPNAYNNHWNRPENTGKGASAFIGKVADGRVRIYQTLPWDWRPWLCGRGGKGTYNDTHIQFEICEDGLENEAYWRQVRAQAVHLCAWLCESCGIAVENVVGHYEAHAAGYANNHGDPRHWMRKFGDSMDLFRRDVAALLKGASVPENGATEGERSMNHYIGRVKTQRDGHIGIWSTPDKNAGSRKRLATVYDGEEVEVLGEIVTGSYAPATAKGAVGFADTNCIVNRRYIDDTQAPELDAGEAASELVKLKGQYARLLSELHRLYVEGAEALESKEGEAMG